MAAKRKQAFGTEWLNQLQVSNVTEYTDTGCKGLVLRVGPNGIKTFYRWENERDAKDPRVFRRKRVKLGYFGRDMSLGDARDAVNKAREQMQSELPGAAVTVAQIAESYREVMLSKRKSGDATWNTIRLHVLDALPYPHRGPFGTWVANTVRAKDLAALVELAKEKRTGGNRQRGGPGTAREVLREAKAIFNHGVRKAMLDSSPATALDAKAFGIEKSSRNRVLNADEIRAFFDVLDLNAILDGSAKERKLSQTVRLALAFQLYVPTRTHSLIGARWDEINWKERTWTIPVDRLKLKPKERKVALPFVVPLPDTAIAILKRLKMLAKDSKWVLASPRPIEAGDGEERQDRHVGAKVLIRALARLQRSGKLTLGTPFTVHDLRRTWRTLAQDLRVPDDAARVSLGHVGLDGVEGVYGRSQLVEPRAQAAAVVAAYLDRLRLGKAAKVVALREKRPIA